MPREAGYGSNRGGELAARNAAQGPSIPRSNAEASGWIDRDHPAMIYRRSNKIVGLKLGNCRGLASHFHQEPEESAH